MELTKIAETRFLIPISVDNAYYNRSKSNSKLSGRGKTEKNRQWYKKAKSELVRYLKMDFSIRDKNFYDSFDVKTRKRKSVAKLYNDNKSVMYHIDYTFFFPDDKARDVSNFVKLAEDLIVDMNLILDDCFVVSFRVAKFICPEYPRTEIDIFAVDNHNINI